ncbi:MAG TPA: porin family protein [Bacteroidaceae bacterium]|nr:porin family protein [Bacteroidaceae bacterium]
MRKIATIIIYLFSILTLSAVKPTFYRYPRINFGIKGGFAATSMIMNKLCVDGHQIDNFQVTSQVGYFASMFTRMNIEKFYLQTELTLNNSRSSVSFDKNSWDINSTEIDLSSFSTSWKSAEIPLLLGYNFIREGPYKMSAFIGPKLKIPIKKEYKIIFSNFSQLDLSEDLRPYVIDLTVGLGCTIGRVIFDFIYDFGLINISKGVNYNNNDPAKVVVLDRHTGVLAFSFGVFF